MYYGSSHPSLVPKTLSDLESLDARGQIIEVDLLNTSNARTVWLRTAKFGRITRGQGYISGDQPRPNCAQGFWAPAPQFWGFPSCVHPLTSLTPLCVTKPTRKFDVVTHMGRDLFLGVSDAFHPSAVPIFWFSVLCFTPFDVERPNSAWLHIWGVACFRGQQRKQ